ncbi:MAG: hypothetical protein AMXMBFR84_29150 [Candidatus Hydrogenedentota bacterium]
MDRQWFCHRNSKKYGPFSETQMRIAWEQGKLTAADPVWTTGMTSWLPAGQVVDQFMPEPATIGVPGLDVQHLDLGLDRSPAHAYKPGSRTTSMELHDRILRACFVAIAVGAAWGIRGSFGHVLGAMFPGAMLGLAFVYVTGQESLVKRMPHIAAISAAGIGLGGDISYGLLHGYAQADTFRNFAYGMFTLLLCGGAWGAYGGAMVGLLLERDRSVAVDWVGGILATILSGGLAWVIIYKVIGFDVNPFRSNALTGFAGGLIGMFAWLVYRKRFRSIRAGLLGFMGFGLGMSLGRLLANMVRNLEPALETNHWNIMEISVGLVGGFVFTFGMLGITFPDRSSKANLSPWQAACSIFVLALIPVFHRITRVNEDRIADWNKNLLEYGSSWTASTVVNALSFIAALGVVCSLVWLYLQWSGKDRAAWFPVLALLLVMTLFQNIFALYYFYPGKPSFFDTNHLYWVIFLAMAGYVTWREMNEGHSDDGDPADTVEPTAWLPILGIAAAGLVIAILGCALANGSDTMKNAETRWPLWSWRDGPFPGS